MITLRNVEKTYGTQTLFEKASLQINLGDRLALVGPNGAGKSTLFRMILEQETPDAGDIQLMEGVTLGYLPQETPSLSGKSALAETLGSLAPDPRTEARAKKILMGLGFRVEDFEKPVNTLSGGWQMRVMIARLLLEEPDLLMLDEPTNHLDLESLLWFQDHLRHYKGSLFIISHDRELINAVTDKIIEVGQGRLKIYNGSYEDYKNQKEAEKIALEEAYKRQQKEIKDLETFINRFRAKASLAASVQSKIKYLERMEKIELPPETKGIGFSFPQPARSGIKALELENIKMSYDGEKWIYDGLDLILERGMRAALVGPNGAGKSTLLKILSGVVKFQEGKRKEGHNIEVGYFSQHRMENFTPGRTVYETCTDTRRAISETEIRSLLGCFLFSGDAVFKKVDVLSGGEKSRLGLAKMLLDPPNLLLMDEPTTHLDMNSVDVLSEALRKFEGTIAFISHDVYFIRQIANQVIHVNNGKVSWYPGGYDYFLHRKAKEKSEEGRLFQSEEKIEKAVHKGGKSPAQILADAAPKSGPKTKEQKRAEAEARQKKYEEKKRRKNINAKIDELKEEEELIVRDLSKPATHKDKDLMKKLMIDMGKVRKEIEKLEEDKKST